MAKLLLVDDQPGNLYTLEAVVAPLGVECATARSGLDALKCLLQEERDFAAILLDVQMPGMDGFELARLIRARPHSLYTPILFLTAAGDDTAFQLQAYAAGAVDFLAKPFVPEILRAKVSVFVDLYNQRVELHRQTELLRQSALREDALRAQVHERERELREQETERQHLAELARREAERAALAEEVRELSLRQRRFLREMLFSLTEGRLRLCDTTADLPKPLPPGPLATKTIALSRPTIRLLRHAVVALGEAAGLTLECIQDLETAVGEAAMNAVVHGQGGRGTVRSVSEQGTVQVWVEDEGSGIAEDSLHRATLERGYTTAGTLGHGFWLMLRTCDRLYLLTGPGGTTVVLEQDATPAEPAWLQGQTAALRPSAASSPISASSV